MKELKDIVMKGFKYIANPIAIGLLVLAAAIFFLGLSLTGFTIQLSLLRHDIPAAQNRLDRQITELRNILVSAEAGGSDFSSGINNDITSGINRGISTGIVELPINTVKDVGGKIKDTAVNTGKTTYSFWEIIKEKVFLIKPATKEAETKKAKK
jgi:hypothetical protein